MTAVVRQAAAPVEGHDPRRTRAWVGPLLIGLLAAGVYAVQLNRASPWRDEVATIDAARRSWAGIFTLTGHVDAVHAAYYLITHLVASLDPGPVQVLDGRVIGVVAMAAGAAGAAVLGRWTDRPASGVFAGLMLAASPLASRYAQEARPFALSTALAVAATLALVAAIRHRGPTRGRWAVYAVAVVLLGVVEVLALLLLVAHAVAVLATRRAQLRAWLVAAAVALVVLSPLLALTVSQRGQVSWLTAPAPAQLARFGGLAVGSTTGVVVLVLATALGAAGALLARHHSGEGGQEPAGGVRGWALPLSWGIGVPVLLWLVSQLHPLFDARYLLFALPGIALLIGRVLARLRRAAGAAALILVAAAGVPEQVAVRGPGGHNENIRALDAAVAAARRPGDMVLFVPDATSRVSQLDPAIWVGTTRLRPDRAAPPAATATHRVLLIQRVTRTGEPETPRERAALRRLARDHRRVSQTAVTGLLLSVWEPSPGAPPSPGVGPTAGARPTGPA